mgnify:CR=1 FL=1
MVQGKTYINKFKLLKPGITLLLDLVAVSTFFLGIENSSLFWKIAPLLISGILASFSSSLLNNYFDRDIDVKMRRTLWRSEFSWDLTYLISIFAMIISSLLISYFYLNIFTTLWILLGFLSYSLLYTLILKRNTSWNIVIGGIAGSFPALAGWSSVNSAISFQSAYVAILIFLWTPTHFWSLAMKYRNDYKISGIPMMPSLLPVKMSKKIIFINTVILVFFTIIPLFYGGFPFIFKVLIIPVSVYLLYEAFRLLTSNMENIDRKAIKLFLASNYFLTAALLLIIIGVISH